MQHAASNRQTATQFHHEKGMEYFRKGEYILAINHLTEVQQRTEYIKENAYKLRLDNTAEVDHKFDFGRLSKEIRLARGLCYFALRDYDKAITDFDAEIYLHVEFKRIPPSDQKPEYKTAIEDITNELTEDIENKPKNARFYYLRGRIHGMAEQWDKAIEDYSNSIELNPYHYTPYHARGYAYLKKCLYHKAEREFEKAISLNPNSTRSHFHISKVYAQTGRFRNAIESLNNLISLEQDEYVILGYIDKAMCHYRLNEFGEVITVMDKYLEFKTTDSHAYHLRGESYFEIGDYQKSIADLIHATNLGNRTASLYHIRGLAYCKIGEYGKAEIDFDKALDLY